MLRIMMPGQKPPTTPTAQPPVTPIPPDPAQAPTPDAGGDADAQSPSGPRYDIQKTTQQISGYLGPESGPFECEHCKHFEAPGECGLVAGPIDAHGCCNLFESGGNQEESEDADSDQESPEEDATEPGEEGAQ